MINKKVVARGEISVLYTILPLTKEKKGIGAFVYIDKNEVVYTNGYFLLVTPNRQIVCESNVVVPVSLISKAKKKKIKKGQMFVGYVTNENGNFPIIGIEDSLSEVRTEREEINYPDWRSVYDTFREINVQKEYSSVFHSLKEIWKRMREVEKEQKEEVNYVEISNQGTYAVFWSGKSVTIGNEKLDFSLLLSRDLLHRFSKFIKGNSIVHVGIEKLEKRTFVRMTIDKKSDICFFFWHK